MTHELARATAAAVLAAGLAGTAACAHDRSADPATSPAPEPATMSPSASASTLVRGNDGAILHAAFERDAASGELRVRYRLDNQGNDALAVFDRGDRHAVLTSRHATGEVPAPLFRDEGNGDLTLSHEALPLPTPSPTVPPVPLAARLAPGAALEGAFAFTGPGASSARRVRWCLGVAPFSDSDFDNPEQAGGVEVWWASFAVVDRQQTLCTPWFDAAAGAFEGD